jgi:hypothetical protein
MDIDELKDLVRDLLGEETEALLADGFEDAFVGVDILGDRVVYDYDKAVVILMDRDDMEEEDAHEHMSYNVLGSSGGDHYPVWMKCP